MGLNGYVVLGSAVVGLLVGLTGAGGGALMTPMLILLFSVKPAAAISSDLVAAVVMRPVGAVVHLRKGTVNLRLVGLMTLGSAPMAFLGAWLLSLLGHTSSASQDVEIALGTALLAGAAAMVLRYIMDRKSGPRTAKVAEVRIRPVPTVAIGMICGLIVGMTSVGSGSLVIVLLLFAYPLLSARRLVGTDLTQAVPLTTAAALGALVFGHVEFRMTASIVVGSVPAVLIGSLLSSRAPDRYIRPAITFVIFVSGLKYVGVGTYPLGWAAGAVLVAGAGYWLAQARSSRTRAVPSRRPAAPASLRIRNEHPEQKAGFLMPPTEASTVLERLAPVPLDDLVLHESVEPARLHHVTRALNRSGVQKCPVLATPLSDGKYLVIDGAHRVVALRRLGAEMALAQIFDQGEYEITAWHHLTRIRRIPPRIEGLLTDRCTACEPGSSTGTCLAVAQTATQARHVCCLSADVGEAAAMLREFAAGCLAAGRIRRISPDDRSSSQPGRRHLRIVYRPWSFDRLREMVDRDLVLPAGITRFIAPGRVLGVDVPLPMLSCDRRTSLASRHIRQHVEKLSLRYYAEPVFIAE